MNDDDLIAGLLVKKDNIQLQINDYKAEINKLVLGLQSINATIKYITGDNNIAPNKRTRTTYFKPNECKVLILDYLRQATLEVTTKDIAIYLAEFIKFDINSPDFVKFQNSIVKTLRKLETKGLVQQTKQDGLTLYWQIKLST